MIYFTSPIYFYFFGTSPLYWPCPLVDVALRRFLKARGYNAAQAKQMILECIQWRRTVEDDGIEQLYRTIDPFNVRSAPSLLHSRFLVFRCISDLRRSPPSTQFPGRRGVFECWPMGFHKVRSLVLPPEMHATNVHPSLSILSDR